MGVGQAAERWSGLIHTGSASAEKSMRSGARQSFGAVAPVLWGRRFFGTAGFGVRARVRKASPGFGGRPRREQRAALFGAGEILGVARHWTCFVVELCFRAGGGGEAVRQAGLRPCGSGRAAGGASSASGLRASEVRAVERGSRVRGASGEGFRGAKRSREDRPRGQGQLWLVRTDSQGEQSSEAGEPEPSGESSC